MTGRIISYRAVSQEMRRAHVSPAFTSCWRELPMARTESHEGGTGSAKSRTASSVPFNSRWPYSPSWFMPR